MPTTRRDLLVHGAALGAAAMMPGCAGSRVRAQSPASPVSETSAPMPQYTPKPLPFDPTKLPGLSEKLLRSHHDNNYVGAARKLDAARGRLAQLGEDAPGFELHALTQAELTFKHSVVLHELYFANLTGGGSQSSATQKLLSDHLGGAAAWEQRFVALAGSLGGGSGWAIVELDLHEKVPRMYSANDHAQGLSSGLPLIVLDMYEHSYHMDYGTAAARYIDAFWANLHWEEIDRRTQRALKIAEAFA